MGFGDEENGLKKSPASAMKTGDFTRNTLHSLILEDLSVKNIRAGFLTLPPFQQPSRPEFVEGQWLSIAERVPFSISEKGGTTAAGPSPTFPTMRDHGVPFPWISPIKTNSYLSDDKTDCQVLFLSFAFFLLTDKK
jgi:hypothetical protein